MIGFLIILFFYFVGEALVQFIGIPVPGAVAGLLLLIGALYCFQKKSETLESTGKAAGFLLRYFPLFLVPVVAGIIDLSDSARENLPILLLISLAALLVSLAMTGLLAQLFFRHFT